MKHPLLLIYTYQGWERALNVELVSTLWFWQDVIQWQGFKLQTMFVGHIKKNFHKRSPEVSHWTWQPTCVLFEKLQRWQRSEGEQVVWSFYSRRYLRVCDSRSRRWLLPARTPSERRPDLQTRRRSPESRTGSCPSPPGLRPCFGGWVRVCERTRKAVFCVGTSRLICSFCSAGLILP